MRWNVLPSVVTPKLVNRRSVTISPSCKRLRPNLSGAEHARRSGRYGEMFQRGRKVKEGRRWLMNLGVTTLVARLKDQTDPPAILPSFCAESPYLVDFTVYQKGYHIAASFQLAKNVR